MDISLRDCFGCGFQILCFIGISSVWLILWYQVCAYYSSTPKTTSAERRKPSLMLNTSKIAKMITLQKREETWISTVQLVTLSCTLIFLKELISSINWIYWLLQERADSIYRVEVVATDSLFALSLFFMQTMFVQRLKLTLTDTIYQYHSVVYILVGANIVLILLAALCMSYLEAFGPSWMLSPCLTVLFVFMLVNSVSVTILFHRRILQIVCSVSTGIEGQIDHLLDALVRLTVVSTLASAGAICFALCNYCNITYVYYFLFPVDSLINICCMLWSVNRLFFWLRVESYFGNIEDLSQKSFLVLCIILLCFFGRRDQQAMLKESNDSSDNKKAVQHIHYLIGYDMTQTVLYDKNKAKTSLQAMSKLFKTEPLQCEVIRKAREKLGSKLTKKETILLKKKDVLQAFQLNIMCSINQRKNQNKKNNIQSLINNKSDKDEIKSLKRKLADMKSTLQQIQYLLQSISPMIFFKWGVSSIGLLYRFILNSHCFLHYLLAQTQVFLVKRAKK
ncbi:hypothetical protein RFI_02601 [Reticulomyxa filosa]|uniref:Uncharacterized protein n=1 Tax=Reticulomyxa filosa TaxID=46433 RepID=X6PA15_RETFI|nr:hypothetical protein RFI_02601 [Reticulomyxa filosa]|eukprot:ETO34492.1 hypothetical protein RFI_02601 [Reticulomyxa filosa]